MDPKRLETGGWLAIVIAILLLVAVANRVTNDTVNVIAGIALVGGIAMIAIGRRPAD